MFQTVEIISILLVALAMAPALAHLLEFPGNSRLAKDAYLTVQPIHRSPVAIIRAEWDGMWTDADGQWLFDALSGSLTKRDVKISRATHLMHLEQSRCAFYRETQTFLKGETTP